MKQKNEATELQSGLENICFLLSMANTKAILFKKNAR